MTSERRPDDALAAAAALDSLRPLLDLGAAEVGFRGLAEPTLESPFVTSAAAPAIVAAASASVAALHAERRAEAVAAVDVDGPGAAVAVRSERYLRRVGEEPESLWDPVSGNFRAADGWI